MTQLSTTFWTKSSGKIIAPDTTFLALTETDLKLERNLTFKCMEGPDHLHVGCFQTISSLHKVPYLMFKIIVSDVMSFLSQKIIEKYDSAQSCKENFKFDNPIYITCTVPVL